jgi:DNA-binding beta-propeller fold protein YncE
LAVVVGGEHLARRSRAGRCADGTGLIGATGVTVSPDGQNAYVASFDSDAVAVFDREPIPPPPGRP